MQLRPVSVRPKLICRLVGAGIHCLGAGIFLNSPTHTGDHVRRRLEEADAQTKDDKSKILLKTKKAKAKPEKLRNDVIAFLATRRLPHPVEAHAGVLFTTFPPCNRNVIKR